ncbi:T9SS type A sorting domain-containing protein [Sabulilitoribacter multivorans]|uniref:T9SS type A sorting domain-containing protein n=1 Tax=Flaviramulus multivorans TaxID=1304750 RepID=A0ABS9IFM6_9FLAO|nr:chondroitinase-B domain-containing protein [Flaviramulus multivorans]MCF7559163.1 T9SS type A sorting domain-containing protein [Flaviramulus multivorans]
MKNYLFLIVLFIVINVNSQVVSNNTELQNAINAATAGTTIVLQNQTWTNIQISINKTGTLENPITIKAETPGSVFFEGVTNVKLGGSYIYFEGVVFRNPPATVSTGTALIDFRTSSSSLCNNCKVTNIKIDAFNQGASQQTSVFKWILLRGANNEVSYSSFLGKHGVGSIINDNRDSSDPNYHKIHHNYFANRTPQGTSVVNDDNDQDAIRIGSSSTSLSDSFTEIYDNYFYNFVGEIEVISNKSGSNKYYNNTFENYSGALTLRHGDNCEVFNNFFLANGQSFSGGIRMMGENHKIYNNYVQGTRAKYPNNTNTNGLAGINIHNGILNSPLNGYYQVKNATIVNNTFVDCDLGIRVGATFSAGTQNQPPQDVIIGNNIIYESTNRAIQVTTQLIGASSKYENNIKQNGTFDSFGSVSATGNINVTSGLLVSGTDFYTVPVGSAAIDYGAGTYSFLTEDILGGIREVAFDAGAEEYGAGGTREPYKQSDVGIVVGFGASGTLSNNEKVYEKAVFKIYPVPTKNQVTVFLSNNILETIEIFDLAGKLLLKKASNSNIETINISNLSKGIYILKANNFRSKFVVE